MIISLVLEPWEIVELVEHLNSALSAKSPYKVDISFNTATRHFSIEHLSNPEPEFKPATIYEERAFEKGGCHATPSECSL